jgi:hypothetical protein
LKGLSPKGVAAALDLRFYDVCTKRVVIKSVLAWQKLPYEGQQKLLLDMGVCAFEKDVLEDTNSSQEQDDKDCLSEVDWDACSDFVSSGSETEGEGFVPPQRPKKRQKSTSNTWGHLQDSTIPAFVPLEIEEYRLSREI